MEEFEGINFKRGFLQLIILALVKKEDMYGLQIIDEAARRSQGLFQTQIGSLYPVLYKLLKSGFITSYEVPSDKYMNRVYYHITDKGKNYLKLLTKQFNDVMYGITMILEESQAENES